MDEDLAVLRRLREEGQIKAEEYEDFVDDYVDEDARAPIEEYPYDGADEASDPEDLTAYPESVLSEETSPEDEEASPREDVVTTPSLRPDLTSGYLATVLITSVGLLIGGLTGVLSWFAAIAIFLVLATTLFKDWQKVTLVGAVAAALITVVTVALPATSAPPDESPGPEPEATTVPVAEASERAPAQPAPTGQPSPDVVDPVDGSLGIHIDEIPELWNTVDSPPQITGGLIRQTETGEYDTFIYRWGDWGRVAGAFDRDTETVYALLITGQFSAEATEQLYMHLCFVVEQFSQECIDAYHEEGLDGGTLHDFDGVDHEAEWTLDEDTWRLQTEGNVLTVRVFGADATP